jgi:copper(I)-binding protein
MLMGLTGELTAGGTIELHLVFEHAGEVVVKAAIRQA